VTVLARTRTELAAARAALPGRVGMVPTMGALHAGHVACVDAARAGCDSVVVSVFVNPMQFDQAADLERYPRTLDADLAICERSGVDVVWAPPVEAVYPAGSPQVWVTAGAIANQLEGPDRPGHFDGMLTVVHKLFSIVRPDAGYFGEKDYQQLALVRQMVADLDLGVLVEGVATVREPDGLALSSRNVFLSPDERARALRLSAALRAGRAAAGTAEAVLAAAGEVLDGVDGADGADGMNVHYLQLRAPDLGPAPAAGPARLLVAATVGATRLIDNTAVELTPAGVAR